MARERVKDLAKQREHPDPGIRQRERAARERAARERLQRVEEALRQLPAVEAAKERQAKRAGKERAARLKEARTSTTDPDARVMKMPDGGFRPAFNVQLATDKDSQVIVGVSVTNHGTDQGEALPVEEQVAIIFAGVNGYLDDMPVAQVRPFEKQFLQYLRVEQPQVLAQIRERKELREDTIEALKQAILEVKARMQGRGGQ